jgi:hypothetical protein
MSKITILKIGLAGGIYKLLTVVFVVIVAQTHFSIFRRMVMMTMQNFGAFGFNPNTFFGILAGFLWAFIAGFIQFGAIAFIFNILVTDNVITKKITKWLRVIKK